jgi:hypothetical protein
MIIRGEYNIRMSKIINIGRGISTIKNIFLKIQQSKLQYRFSRSVDQ